MNDIRQAFTQDQGLAATQKQKDVSNVLDQPVTLKPGKTLPVKGSPRGKPSKNIHSVSEDDINRLKAENDKKVSKLKKAAEVQMRNVKMMAKDRAKKMVDETLANVKKKFEKEMLHMMLEFDQLREVVVKKDREVKSIAANLILQEALIAEKNTRMIAAQILECGP